MRCDYNKFRISSLPEIMSPQITKIYHHKVVYIISLQCSREVDNAFSDT